MSAWRERTSSLLDLEGSVTLQQGTAAEPRLSPVDESRMDNRGAQPSPSADVGGSASPMPAGQPGDRVTSAVGPPDSAIFAAISSGGGSMDSLGSGSPGPSMGMGMGLLRVPRSPSFPAVYGTGRSYNIRIGEEQQVLAKFTPRTSQPVFYLGDTVSGVLSFPPASQSKKPLKKHWRCLEVSVQLETHESNGPDSRLGSSRNSSVGDLSDMSPSVAGASASALDLDSATSSTSNLTPSKGGAWTSVVVRMEYHEVVLDLLSTHFLFTIPADAPVSQPHSAKAVQWVLHFEFVAVAIPRRERKPRQSDKGTGKPKAQHLGTIAEGQGEDASADAAVAEDDESDEDDEGLLQLLVEHQHVTSAHGLQAEKAEWSMPISVQAPPLAKRSS